MHHRLQHVVKHCPLLSVSLEHQHIRVWEQLAFEDLGDVLSNIHSLVIYLNWLWLPAKLMVLYGMATENTQFIVIIRQNGCEIIFF